MAVETLDMGCLSQKKHPRKQFLKEILKKKCAVEKECAK
jgi:hypothetical protein